MLSQLNQLRSAQNFNLLSLDTLNFAIGEAMKIEYLGKSKDSKFEKYGYNTCWNGKRYSTFITVFGFRFAIRTKFRTKFRTKICLTGN